MSGPATAQPRDAGRFIRSVAQESSTAAMWFGGHAHDCSFSAHPVCGRPRRLTAAHGAVGRGQSEGNPARRATYNSVSMVLKDKGWLEREFAKDASRYSR